MKMYIEKQFKEFKVGSRYLVKDKYDGILEIIVLEISEKAIKVKFDNSNIQWHLKDSMPFEFVEDLSNVNKLEWQDNPPENLMNWDEAMEYAKSLGESWRLPTRVELIDAYDNNVQGFLLDYNWSSTTFSRNTNNAWCVNLYDGNVSNGSKTYGSYVRCVREVKL